MSTLLATPAGRMGVSVAAATALYGISFGALAVAAGLDVWQAVVLSAVMFTGGSQFALIGTLATGGGFGAATAAASLLGVRNAIYGVQLNSLLALPTRLHPLAAQLTIDESMATAMAQGDLAEQRRGFWTAGLGVWVGWTSLTLAGALLGERLGDPRVFGLDGAAVAAFTGLLWPRLKGGDAWALAGVCAVVTAACLPTLPPGVGLLVAAGVAAAWALVRHRWGRHAGEVGLFTQSSDSAPGAASGDGGENPPARAPR